MNYLTTGRSNHSFGIVLLVARQRCRRINHSFARRHGSSDGRNAVELRIFLMYILHMIDISQLEGFDWDNANTGKLRDSGRDISEAETEQIFANQPLLLRADTVHSDGEPRFHALGKTDAGRRLFAVFTLRANGTLIRPISVRVMSPKERRYYAEA